MTGKPRVEMKENYRKKSIAVFQEVYGLNKEDPEHYFKQMSAVTNYKNIKLQKNTKWGNVLDRTDMGTRFLAGVMSNIDETDEPKSPTRKPSFVIGKPASSKQKTLDSQSMTNDQNALPGSVVNRTRRNTLISVSEDEEEFSKPFKGGILDKLKGVPESDQFDEVFEREKSPAKPAFRNKLISTKDQNFDLTDENTNKQTERQTSENKGTGLKLPAISKLKNIVSTTEEAADTKTQTEVKENKPPGGKNSKTFLQTPQKNFKTLSSLKLEKSKTSIINDEPQSPTQTEKSASATTIDRKTRKRKRLTSALLISQAKASDGAVPLPLISTENTSRPFFYWNGLREEDYVTPFLDQVTKHKGADSRERAIKSLTIANTFKEKPWLAQVRMALSLTSLSLRRSMTEMLED